MFKYARVNPYVMKKIYFILAVLLPVFASGQYVFNAALQNVKFGGPGVTIQNKVGNGTTAGSIVLYQNVVNIGGQRIDAIIRTISVSTGAQMVFDQAGTGTGYTNNNPTWFSPQFLFPFGGGNAVFEFEFILGNSFSNATNTGTQITLQNMMINSYDIDGNDDANTNQFSEFGGFSSSEMSTTTSIATTYNATTNLTRFASTISSNVVDASSPNTRVRVTYDEMSIFRIAVGSIGPGVAYFFIDFDKGIDFTTPTRVITAPSGDLNPSNSGNGNSSSQCANNTDTKFTSGTTNINSVSSTPSGGTTLERIRVTFPTSDIRDGSAERLILNNNGNSIQLNFANGASINNVTLTGTQYTVTATVANGESTLSFMKRNSTTMTLAEGEKLLDAMYYSNTSSNRTAGTRNFEVRFKDGAYESAPSNYIVAVGSSATISQQPSSSVIAQNQNTAFQTNATGGTYQWQVNTGNGTWTNISNGGVYGGATTNRLTITNAPLTMNNYQYRAVVTGTGTCSNNTNAAILAVNASLPVKWLNVTGAIQHGGILVKWGTAQEVNTTSFSIGYSTDGKNFKNVGEVNAAGNSNVNTYYSFLHTQPTSGNNYYRIQQFDADGKSTYSKIIVVGSADAAASVNVLGNPVSNGQLSVQISQPMNIMLFSADGKLIRQQQAIAGTHTINVNSLSKGMYTLVAGTQAKRILINN